MAKGELLIELLSDEIPARMQQRAVDDLEKQVGAALVTAGLPPRRMESHVTPRRLCVIATGLPARQPNLSEERRGPRPDAPAKAIEGFLKSTGLTRDQLVERSDGKASFLYAIIDRIGRPTPDVLADLLPPLIRNFAWPKSMRWGERSREMTALRWVRPLHSILCLFNGEPVGLELEGVKCGNVTRGHRFHGNALFRVDDAESYRTKLRVNHVILDHGERMKLIAAQAEKLATAAGLALVEDAGLLAENAGLTEWPVPLLGRFDPAFLAVPREAIQLTMRTNQKYFALTDPATGALSSHFICVANLEAADRGKAIIAGNEKVLAARLSDARFFWEQDLKTPLEALLPKLEAITFHEKLGTVAQKAERVAQLARQLAPSIPGCDPDHAERAARLAKADLVTGMVGEFPELQGLIGGYLAAAQGEPAEVAQAIREHYQPLGPSDTCPTAPASVAVALADKIDTLVGFFAIDEKPTGSRDPFALRRAALGVIRLLLENSLLVRTRFLFEKAGDLYNFDYREVTEIYTQLEIFFYDRLCQQQKEKGIRSDIIYASIMHGGQMDGLLCRTILRSQALQGFIYQKDGTNLLAGYKRAANILAIEEKRDGCLFDQPVDPALLADPAEQALNAALDATAPAVEAALATEDFPAAMAALARLRPAVDAFFESVLVNAPEPQLRANRLALLNRMRAGVDAVADFSRIEG